MLVEENLKTPQVILTKRYFGNEAEYPKYDNYDGINVNKTQDIPLDFKGVMGVPITFLHKFNPDQFEIIKFRKGNDDKIGRVMDKLYQLNISGIFLLISLAAVKKFGVATENSHLDATSLSVEREYN